MILPLLIVFTHKILHPCSIKTFFFSATNLWQMLVSLGQVSFEFLFLKKLLEFVYSQEYTTLFWFNKLYLNFRLELSAHTL